MTGDPVQYDRHAASSFDAGRRISPEAMRVWLDAIAESVAADTIHTVVDVGCGTGRFLVPLATRFAARVIGVDPSEAMLEIAARDARNAGDARIELVAGTADHLPVGDGVADLVFMSMVLHHVGPPVPVFRECRRVLKPDGTVCVRNSTTDRLDSVAYLRFFPGARVINEQRLPSREEVVAAARAGGFDLVHHRIVEQVCASSLAEYAERVRRRGHSDLRRLPDEEFERGIAAMTAAGRRADVQKTPITEAIDLFVFGRYDSSESTISRFEA